MTDTVNATALANLPVVSLRPKNETAILGLLKTPEADQPVTIYTFSNDELVIDRVSKRSLRGDQLLCDLTATFTCYDHYHIVTRPGFKGLRDLALVCAVDCTTDQYPVSLLISAINNNPEALFTIYRLGGTDASKRALEELKPEDKLDLATKLHRLNCKDPSKDLPKLLTGSSFEAIMETFGDQFSMHGKESFRGQRPLIIDALIKADRDKTRSFLQGMLSTSPIDQIRIDAFNTLASAFMMDEGIKPLLQTVAEDSDTPMVVRKHIARHFSAKLQSEWAFTLLSTPEFQD